MRRIATIAVLSALMLALTAGVALAATATVAVSAIISETTTTSLIVRPMSRLPLFGPRARTARTPHADNDTGARCRFGEEYVAVP